MKESLIICIQQVALTPLHFLVENGIRKKVRLDLRDAGQFDQLAAGTLDADVRDAVAFLLHRDLWLGAVIGCH